MGSHRYESRWATSIPPENIDIRAIALEARDNLPEPLRSDTMHIKIEVTDFPCEELGETLGLETPFDLLGIFEGSGRKRYWTPRTTSSKTETLTLFRRAILDYWAENRESLGEVVSHIVANELGHHYGLNDREIGDIEYLLN
ncbi:MAG: metallopeptidase family protein [Pseudomonadota bacterium]